MSICDECGESDCVSVVREGSYYEFISVRDVIQDGEKILNALNWSLRGRCDRDIGKRLQSSLLP